MEMRRTKIVCTIGPATRNKKIIRKLIKAGMNVARLNFSHDTQECHGEAIRIIRETASNMKRSVAILQDIGGPKIRIGTIENGPVHLKPGQSFTITTRDVPGNTDAVSVSYSRLPEDVQTGDTLLLSDGSLELSVKKVEQKDITCKVVVGGPLDSHKGINLPDRSISAPILSKKDLSDLAFGIDQGVDYVAISFVRNAGDVIRVKDHMGNKEGAPRLIAKIEKHEALTCINEILPEVDGLMVARGDLGVEIPIEKTPGAQKRLIDHCNRAGKPVITATQMLKSMVESPRPTRAEVTDVANAILDGSDAIMLSEETAVGNYPIEAVRMMSKIAIQTESEFPFDEWYKKYGEEALSPQKAVARSACRIAQGISAAAIITSTQSGSTTQMVSRYRPAQPILAMTPDRTTYRRLALIWGAVPLLIEETKSTDELEKISVEMARKQRLIKCGDQIVFTAGIPLNVTGTTNLIKIATCPMK